MEKIEIGETTIDVVKKDIKNVHLAVLPPNGKVRISAPERMNLETIRIFAISKLHWIRKQQRKMQEQEREPPREFLNRERHYFKGRRYLLKIVETQGYNRVVLKHRFIELHVKPHTSVQKKQEILQEWYRKQLKEMLPPMIEQWEKRMGVTVKEFRIKRMKTKWGTCNPDAGRIWINLELAKKPKECLEYILVHEMTHLKERTHNDRFKGLMNLHMPKWKYYRDELNRLPVSHDEWEY